mmetsp:Transcript_9687/g.12088  ORF Transcript_9687/g.12088 Transcript_9687/m.12088 type:complete len:118 (+) Transcript_9687:310-663(+)
MMVKCFELQGEFQGIYTAVKDTLKAIQTENEIFPKGRHSERLLVEDVYLPDAATACNSIISRASRLVQLKRLQVVQNIYGEKLVHNQSTIEYFTRKRLQEIFQQFSERKNIYSWDKE